MGKLNLPKATQVNELAEACCKWACLDPHTQLEWYEEIKFEPSVMCEPIAPKHSLVQCQLEDGDILIFQASVPEVGLPLPSICPYIVALVSNAEQAMPALQVYLVVVSAFKGGDSNMHSGLYTYNKHAAEATSACSTYMPL